MAPPSRTPRTAVGSRRAARPPVRWRLWPSLGATLLCAAAACGPRGTTHYADPEQMIAVFEDPERDEWQRPDDVMGALPPLSDAAVVAEIGAGSGYFTRRLARRVSGGRVYAVEVEVSFFDHVERQRELWGTPNVQAHLGHYEDPMLPFGEVDLLFSANTVSYIGDRVRYFKNARTALTQEGRVVLIDFVPDARVPGAIAPPPSERVSAQTLEQELSQAGYVLERTETFLPYQYMLVFKRSTP